MIPSLVLLFILSALVFAFAATILGFGARIFGSALRRRSEARVLLSPGWWLRFERDLHCYAASQCEDARDAERRG